MLSGVLYVLWQLLWHIWESRLTVRRFWPLLGFVVFILFVVISYEHFFNPGLENDWRLPLIRLLLGVITVLIIQYALRAQKNIAQLSLEKEQLQTENYKTQLRALQSQVDPHFLFNSLNTLRSMVRQKHENSEKFVMSLSDFFRQSLNHNGNNALKLDEELELLEAYLFLMKSRNEAGVNIKIDVDKKLYPLKIPTLALQIVVENCFKHNSMSSKKPLRIEIGNLDDERIVVRNIRQPVLSEELPSGKGLKLLENRYELMNIEKGVEIEESSTHFTVYLKLLNP